MISLKENLSDQNVNKLPDGNRRYQLVANHKGYFTTNRYAGGNTTTLW